MRADAKKNYEHILEVARQATAEQGADVSLRDVARRAGVGIGTLYRHFATREALLEALLRDGFERLAQMAQSFDTDGSAAEGLVAWLRAMVTLTHSHRGVIALMTAAIEAPDSALHAACVSLKASGAGLLARAQAEGAARHDVDGTDLLALISALAWLNDQPPFAARVDHLFEVVTSAILIPSTRAG